ncbi:MAG: MBL fold metallo-hydrolase [Desulfuromonadales bacterium]|nr:MBL fold metallo-hydrolase [Desulfuromonadales bacterium]
MNGKNAFLYSAELQGTPVLFDTGPDTDEARRYLRENVELDRLAYVFITHCHPDHCGLMRFLQQESDAKIVISRYDLLGYQKLSERIALMSDILEPFGFPESEISRVQEYLIRFDKTIPLPEHYLVLEDFKDYFSSKGLDYLHCPGHSQSDIVYLFDDCAVTGDVVLSELFTTPLLDVDVESLDGRFKSYAAYCQTIRKLMGLDGKEILPSHLAPINRISEPVLYFVSKLLSRAEVLSAHLGEGKSLYQCLLDIFGDEFYLSDVCFLKISEVFFLYDFLMNPQELAIELEELKLFNEVEKGFSPFLR